MNPLMFRNITLCIMPGIWAYEFNMIETSYNNMQFAYKPFFPQFSFLTMNKKMVN